MRQSNVEPVTLRPGDTLTLTHKVDVQHNGRGLATLVGWRWEPVFATHTPPELAALLEAVAADTVIA